MQNGTISKVFENGINMHIDGGTDINVTSVNIDVVDGKVYGLNVIYSGHNVDRDDGAEASMLLSQVDVMLQVLGVNTWFDWSSDSADYDPALHGVAVFEVLGQHVETITAFAAIPGAVVNPA